MFIWQNKNRELCVTFNNNKPVSNPDFIFNEKSLNSLQEYIEDNECIVPSVGHDWIPATCLTPKTCSRCNATRGRTAPHRINDSGICTDCGESFVRTITFQNGNTGNAEMPASISGIMGKEITLPADPRLSSYNFEGWYSDKACTTLFEGTTFSEDLTLYAKWVSNIAQQMTVLSYNGSNSNATNADQPIRKAIASANNPDIVCLQKVGSNWKTFSLPGYTASPQNKNTQDCVIFYSSTKFDIIASSFAQPYSYVILKRKADGCLFAVIDVLSDNSLDPSILWNRIDGIWNDVDRGLMPMIITGSFGSGATPTDSNVYKSLTESGRFFDSFSDTKSAQGTADVGDYVFVSYHMQSMVESYEVLGKQNGRYPVLVNVALPDVCPHVLTKTEATDATCEVAGNKEYYTCTIGGKIYTDEYGTIETTIDDCTIPALGHDYEWIIDTEPTFTTEGVKHQECTVCHNIRNENTVIDKITS